MIPDAAAAPELIVEAVRWRLQRVTAVLSAAGDLRSAPGRARTGHV